MKKLTFDIKRAAAEFLERVSGIVEESLSNSDSEYLEKILKHTVSVKGHMIRPYVAYVSAMAVNHSMSTEQFKKLEYFAAAVELLHNASLIHDDVLDEEVARRGVDCLYRVFGSKNAILAGNIYYIKAIELVVRHVGIQEALSLLDTAGEMCQGEILQQQYEATAVSEDIYLRIIKSKTASLIALSCSVAGRIAGADSAEAEEIRKLGELLGIIYQLQDDLKDMDANVERGFDFDFHIKACVNKFEHILQGLPESEHSKLYCEFLNKLIVKSKAS